MTAPAALTTNFASLVNELGAFVFGLVYSGTGGDVISNGQAAALDANAPAQILRAMTKGLQNVYYPPDGYIWSFLRPTDQYLTTYAPYATGTITVTTGGVVSLVGGTPSDGGFPSYSASSFGQLWIGMPVPPLFFSGIWTVSTWTNAYTLTLANYTGPAFTSGIPYQLVFNHYALPSNVDSLAQEMTLATDSSRRRYAVERTDEVVIRDHLQHGLLTDMPRMYALTTGPYTTATAPGSSRFVSFWPVPDHAYQFYGKATIRPTMLDATNQYPVGAELLSGVIVEACLAAAERDIQQIDAGAPRRRSREGLPDASDGSHEPRQNTERPEHIGPRPRRRPGRGREALPRRPCALERGWSYRSVGVKQP